MFKKLTILFAPMEGVGHVNACIGLAQVLQNRGHKIVFVVDQSIEGTLKKYGFVEEVLENEELKDKKPGEEAANQLLQSGLLSGNSSYEKMKIMTNMKFFTILVDKMVSDEPKVKAIVNKHNPDIYIIDHFVGSPTLIHSGKPWVYLFSGNPLFIIDDKILPPNSSGYSVNGDQNEWKKFREIGKNLFAEQTAIYNKWMKENGFPETTNGRCISDSPYLSIYGYPQELDYIDIKPLPKNYCRIDAFMRKDPKEFKIPDKLENRDKTKSKLIYLSMGSMGSVDVNLMKRFVEILSKTQHKYIVSKGLLAHKYDLADNMWGEASVPQTNVLPLVDLVITHGGNNSVTETFSYGKPMIVMPLFADQFDNAQRIHEKGYGIRLDTYSFSDKELLDSIEKLLNDKQLDERLSIASKRMLNSDSIHKACERIENLLN